MTSRKEGEGGKAKCDTSTQGLRHKGVTEGGGGVKNCPNLHDVIYECPLCCAGHFGPVVTMY